MGLGHITIKLIFYEAGWIKC